MTLQSVINNLDKVSDNVYVSDDCCLILKGVIYMPPYSGKTTIMNSFKQDTNVFDTDFLRYYYKPLPQFLNDLDWSKYYKYIFTNRHSLRAVCGIRPTEKLRKKIISSTNRKDKHLLQYYDDIYKLPKSTPIFEYDKVELVDETVVFSKNRTSLIKRI